MSSQSQNYTPSWKVNLTQKFNKAYKRNQLTKNNKQTFSFDEQLEQRLNFIPIQREQLSTNKKDNLLIGQNKGRIMAGQQSQENENITYENNQKTKSVLKLVQNVNNQQKLFEQKHNNKEQYQKTKIQPLNFDSQTFHKNQQISQYDSIFTNSNITKLFNKYFPQQNETIELKQFVHICCQQFLTRQKQKQLSTQIKQLLIDQCRVLFCTTDQNIISLNAIEMLTKKNDLKLIILQKLMQIKYQKRKQKLQQKYQQILIQIVQQQQIIKNQQHKLQNKKTKIQAQQKQLKKKLSQIKNHQKQLLQKQKQIKKTLQEKHNKLTQQLQLNYDKLYKQIQKKANTFQRNARNKLQLIQKRSTDFMKIIQSNNNNLMIQSLSSSYQQPYEKQKLINKSQKQQKHYQQSQQQQLLLNQNHKLNNQLYLLKNKLKKTQKQLFNIKQIKNKQFQQLQNQSNSLLKMNTLLEGKLQKTKMKVKELSQILVKRQSQINKFKQEMIIKDRLIDKLQGQMLQIEHQSRLMQMRQQQQLQQQNQQQQQLQLKQYLPFNKIKNHPNNNNTMKIINKKINNETTIINPLLKEQPLNNSFLAQQNNQNNQILITSINNILMLIIQGFNNNNNLLQTIKTVNNNTQNNQLTQSNLCSIKIQQALINQSTKLFITCSTILWQAITTLQQSNISYIIEFMLKLFLAKFSFLKFQSLTNQQNQQQQYNNKQQYRQNTMNQLQQFVQSVSINLLQNDQHLNVQQKLKASSIFISQYDLKQTLQKRLNIYLVLLVLGIDQIFNFKTGKLQPIVKKIFYLINNLQSQNFIQIDKKKFVKKFYDQQIMTFLLWKYMSFTSSINQTSIFMDLLIELCNINQNFQNDFNKSNPLFKTIYALENYKLLVNFLIINFTQKNLNKNNKQLRQTLQKVSIILQRFCYFYKGQLNISQEDIKRINKIMNQINKNLQFNDSMFKANMKSILDAINQNQQYHQ